MKKQILKEVLQCFNENMVKYVLIRSYGFLLNDLPFASKDFDLLISSNDIMKADVVLQRLNFFRMCSPGLKRHLCYGRFINKESSLLFVDLHLGGLSHHDIIYLSFSQAWAKKEIVQDYYVLSNEDKLIMYLLHCSMLKRRFDEKTEQEINYILENNKINLDAIKDHLRSLFSESYANKVFDQFINKKYREIEKQGNSMLFRIVCRKRGYLYYFIKKIIRNRMLRLHNKFLSKNMLICFLGVDGAGKSTLLNEIKDILSFNKRRVIVVYSGKGQKRIMPGLSKTALKFGVKTTHPSQINKLGSIKRFFLTNIRDLFYLLDMYLRYIVRIYPHLLKGGYVLTDRYAYDLYLDENTTFLTKKILINCFPSPSLTIYLYNNAEIVFNRKKQYSVSELERQMIHFEKLKRDLQNKGKEVVSYKNESLDKTINDLLSLVFDKSHCHGFFRCHCVKR